MLLSWETVGAVVMVTIEREIEKELESENLFICSLYHESKLDYSESSAMILQCLGCN